ncbi:MAG: PIN domain-containing protein, partial [Promethearchaeia archaeon]
QKNMDKFQRQLRASLSYFDEVKDQYPIEIQYVAKKKKAQPIDDFLVEQCTHLKDKYEQKQIYLATNDYNLRRRARKAEINQIYVKQKKYLQIG